MNELDDTFTDDGPEALHARVDAWNYLIHIVEPWRGTPGHDGQRWRLLEATGEMTVRRARRPRR